MSEWQLYFHIVWTTKRRQPFLTREKEEAVCRGALAIAAQMDCQVLALNGMPDHMHLLIRTGPQFDLSALMKRIKGSTSALLNESAGTVPEERFRWQEGYYAVTVTPSHLPRVQAYIQRQKEHHDTGVTYPSWEAKE